MTDRELLLSIAHRFDGLDCELPLWIRPVADMLVEHNLIEPFPPDNICWHLTKSAADEFHLM